MQAERTQLIDDVGSRLFQFRRTSGRAPNSTCLRTNSKALSPSKSDFEPAGGDEAFTSVGLLGVLGQPSSSSENAKETIINIDREKYPGSCFDEVSFISSRRN
jgi:hypothetical protein